VTVRIGLLERLPRGHVHLADVRVGARVESRVVREGDPVVELAARSRPSRELGRYLLLGVEHIFTGWDHLAFLVGLLLLGGSLRAIAAIVTSFTIAHSVTLALAVLGALAIPQRVVEPLIAGSVVYVALENLRALRRGAGPPLPRAGIAFGFGLVHGFGFAGILGELGLPPAGLAASLLSFNLGVELGQLAVVSVAVPALGLLARRPRLALAAVRGGSVVIGVAGVSWLVARVGGS
jgi:hypothetical protein